MNNIFAYALIAAEFDAYRNPFDVLSQLITRSLLLDRRTVGFFELGNLQTWVNDDWGIQVPILTLEQQCHNLKKRQVVEIDTNEKSHKQSFRVVPNEKLLNRLSKAEREAEDAYKRVLTAITKARGETNLEQRSADEIVEVFLDGGALNADILPQSASSQISKQELRDASFIVKKAIDADNSSDAELLEDITEVVLDFRPVSSLFKMDHGFI